MQIGAVSNHALLRPRECLKESTLLGVYIFFQAHDIRALQCDYVQAYFVCVLK